MPQRATLPRRLAAVWFADITGYGRLTSENEDEALQLVRVFQRACRDLVHRHEGRLVKFTGDGAIAEFPSTEAAVRAACALEPTFRARAKASELTPPHLHVGLHVGEIATGPDGDLYGEGLNLAARLEDLAGPGQVLVSDDVRRQLHQRPEFRFVPLGERAIPDSDEPVSVFCVVERAAVATAAPDAVAGRWRVLHHELARRRVYAATAMYAVAAALAAAALLLSRLGSPEWVLRGLALTAVLGLPLTVLLAWTFEVGREGLRRYGRTLDEPGAEASPRLAFLLLVLVSAVAAWGISFMRPPAIQDLPALPANRVAVLYFDDISPGRNLGYLVDGLTETLIQELSGVPDLEVVSRNGVKPFRGGDAPVDSMAAALHAGTLVQGSLSESEGQLRVTVQLIDGASGTVLDRDVVERAHGELFALQDDLAERVARFLRRRLGEEIRLAEQRAGATSVEAWEIVQRAEQLRQQGLPLAGLGGLEQAGRLFDQADSLLAAAAAEDPSWAEPVVQRGRLAHERARWTQWADVAASLPWNGAGLAHAAEALRRAPGSADALALRGSLRAWRSVYASDNNPVRAEADLEAAEEDLRAAVEADPRHASAWSNLSWALAAQGETEEAKRAAEQAYAADAYLAEANEILWRLFAMSYDLDQPAESDRWCAEWGRRFPEDPRSVICQIFMLTVADAPPDPARAWTLLDEFTGRTPSGEVMRRKYMEMLVAAVLARAGLPDSALAVAARARADVSQDPAREIQNFEAFVRTLAGRPAEAVALLQSVLAATPHRRAEVAKTWWFEDLHGRPDFEALVARTDSLAVP